LLQTGQLTFNLFPASGLDNSLFAAVLLGLLCLYLLNESFGWVFTGLVVPGYLASVFVIQPLAGGVILVEAVATYLVARCVSDWLSPWMPWNRFFGRERFFLILLCSVAVRLLFEAALLPALGERLAEEGWVAPSLVTSLFSVGLIVVPLTANMMWRTGLERGLPQVVVATGLIWAALGLVLIPYTNLSISDFELSYENVAQGFLASPKTYIILLVGAYLATRSSITWGWDSHGIVVVALVALAWLSPLKVVTTVTEVLLLVAAVRLLLGLPGLRTANLEGPRRIVVVFSVGFVLKYALCHVLAAGYPGLKATDYFGFGYLLPSLLALKVLQRGSAAKVLLPTLETSLAALVLGVGIGLGLALLDPAEEVPGPEPRQAAGGWEEPADDLAVAVQQAAGQLLSRPPSGRRSRAWPEELATWRRLVTEVVAERGAPGGAWEASADALGLRSWGAAGGGAGDRYRVLAEPPGRLDGLDGWGIVAVRRDGGLPLVVEVPRPISEPGSLAGGVALALELDAAVLLVSGVDLGGQDVMTSLALGSEPPLLHARRAVSLPALEVRTSGGEGPCVLERGGEPSRQPDLAALARIVGPVEEQRREGASPGEPTGGAARHRLVLSAEGVARGLAAAFPPEDGRPVVRTVHGGLSALGGEDWFVDRVSAWGWRAPLESELLLFERELLEPLLIRPEAVVDDELARLDRLASVLGYSLERVELGDGELLLLLAEEQPALRGWGSVLVRPGAGSARFLAVPNPELEPHTLDLALHLMRDLDAAALVVAAAGPADVAADAASGGPIIGGRAPAWTGDLFTSAHRVALRAGRGEARAGLQVRGRAAGRELDAHLALTGGVLAADLAVMSPGLGAAVGELDGMGIAVQVDDGRRALADLHGHGIPQVRLARNLDGLPLAVLWASPGLRSRISPSRGLALTRAARRAGLGVEEVWLDRWWAATVPAGARRVEGASLLEPPDRLGADWRYVLDACAALMRTADLRYLGDLARRADERGVDLSWLVDRESELPVLWLRRAGTAAGINLLAPDADWSGSVTRPVAALRTGLAPLVLVEEVGAPAGDEAPGPAGGGR